MIIDSRMMFLALTAFLLLLLLVIGLSTYSKSKTKKLEEPKYRMLDDD